MHAEIYIVFNLNGRGWQYGGMVSRKVRAEALLIDTYCTGSQLTC